MLVVVEVDVLLVEEVVVVTVVDVDETDVVEVAVVLLELDPPLIVVVTPEM